MNVAMNAAAGTNMIGDWYQYQQQYCYRCCQWHYGFHLCPQPWTPVTSTITYAPHVCTTGITAEDVKRIVCEALAEHDKVSGDRLVAALEKLAGVKTGGKK